mmetsp:Transcript_35231/g.54752  ORF Transcript_35231/g.54752 Transcript_35231/m.54752 type:complete len:105 (-) Transcript_35231:593-907(-)
MLDKSTKYDQHLSVIAREHNWIEILLRSASLVTATDLVAAGRFLCSHVGAFAHREADFFLATAAPLLALLHAPQGIYLEAPCPLGKGEVPLRKPIAQSQHDQSE